MTKAELWESRRPDLVYQLELKRQKRNVGSLSRKELHRMRKVAFAKRRRRNK